MSDNGSWVATRGGIERVYAEIVGAPLRHPHASADLLAEIAAVGKRHRWGLEHIANHVGDTFTNSTLRAIASRALVPRCDALCSLDDEPCVLGPDHDGPHESDPDALPYIKWRKI